MACLGVSVLFQHAADEVRPLAQPRIHRLEEVILKRQVEHEREQQDSAAG